MSRIFGYTRVSTEDQTTERQQLGELTRLFTEKRSGKDMKRPELERMLDQIYEGDRIVVFSIDRLARSIRDLGDIVDRVKTKGASIEFITEKLTFHPDTDDPMQDLMFQILGSFAEFERKIMLKRQAEGIAKAKERGVYQGRKATIDPERVRELLKEGVGASEAARMLGISRQSVYRLSKA